VILRPPQAHLRLLCFAYASLCSACGGGGGGSSSKPPSPPIASPTASPPSGQAPLTVTFDASKSTDPQGYALTYSWSFGDGTSATGATVSHIFQKHGTYTASVSVDDGHNTATAAPSPITVMAAPPTLLAPTLTLNVLGVMPASTQGTLSATDREDLPLTYSISTQSRIGTATVDPQNKQVTYSVPGFTSGATDGFAITVSNGFASTTATVTVKLNADPLLPNQWHIQNTGHDAFASTAPVAGNDMDVAAAWAARYSGRGVKVGVVDSGIEASHEDLALNLDVAHSYNFLTQTNDPTPTAAGPDHGTQVAGIIGAVAFNGKGGRGVAYNAILRGYNLLAPGAFSVANMTKAMGGDSASSDNDVFNASFASYGAGSPTALPSFSGVFQALTQNAMSLRNGRGAAIVNAAGNEFGTSSSNCQVSRQFNVSCGDPASDERRGGYYPIIVAALNAAGTHSSYSNTGSSIWISAPGGEYGLNSAYVPGSANYDPAIVTTSRGGCGNAAYAPPQFPNGANPLDSNGANPLASNCQYTAVMNGTSAATPNVTAVVAMMLEANPQLSVRDIKYILAKTAKRTDPNFPGVSSASVVSESTIVLEQGWVTNAAGYAFSNRYGFGAIDAGAAVAMAKTYSTYLPPAQNSTGNYLFLAAPPATIPKSPTGAFLQFSVSESFQTVEFATVFLNVDTTPGLACNQVELTSPSGTKSILLHAANGFTNAAIANSRFESNAFYGERINGNWTLRFYDFCVSSNAPTTLSTVLPQALLLSGY
jgi:subtilisin family serine protease